MDHALVVHFSWWLLPDSNWGHKALQASALPTELKSHDRLRYSTDITPIFQLPEGTHKMVQCGMGTEHRSGDVLERYDGVRSGSFRPQCAALGVP